MFPPLIRSLLLYNKITENSVLFYIKVEKLKDFLLSKI
ncbi:hypothetical protein BCB4264_A2874 [Bacillus cereus B4264]|uniref:Uncharacterized protein n=1 Tax=Bacillus cereus (strain B4264) TaxID=405532 RepID=B7HA83_BACC4|nr:hypothetical protein BCB4264_A2874 [Bacillus cereus B4264]EDZ50497.1 hypothetical protein BCAH1134_2885 [Bacillus cereus AH1134]KLA35108.1 hypothetical protein B4080_2651 [Bacillus cereus]QDD84117.1 hypothetical protein FORC087_2820 [Bacillus cereus]